MLPRIDFLIELSLDNNPRQCRHYDHEQIKRRLRLPVQTLHD